MHTGDGTAYVIKARVGVSPAGRSWLLGSMSAAVVRVVHVRIFRNGTTGLLFLERLLPRKSEGDPLLYFNR